LIFISKRSILETSPPVNIEERGAKLEEDWENAKVVQNLEEGQMTRKNESDR
jgi:hypothetical protein